jgi:leader peptidase (prepilin peptidase) / N-methyltransferase
MNPFFVFFLGAILGSFFYTLSVRFIDGSFAKNKFKALFGSSICPKCGHRINPAYLIPVISFIILRRKCKECGAGISVIYPLMEIMFGALACLINYKLGFNVFSVIVFLITGISVSISMIDIKIFTIPNSLIIVFLVLCVYPVITNNNIKENLFGFLLMGIFFTVVLLIFPGSFGGGDVKLAAAIGIFLGLDLSIVALEAALVSGSIVGAVYAIKSKKGFKIKMPFAPFLTAGMIVSLLYGRDILLVYYRVFY